MRFLSLLFVFVTLFCYTGLCANLCFQESSLRKANCHTTSEDNHQGTTTAKTSYKETNPLKPLSFNCKYMLPSIPQNSDFNSIAKDILAFNFFYISHVIEREKAFYPSIVESRLVKLKPPELFLKNLSLIL